MGKIIITEDEKLRILNLYENSNFGEEESEVVGYYNPFRHTQYLPYFRRYSSELKDGDYFFTNRGGKMWIYLPYENDRCINNTISGKITDFDNKTFRYDDEVRRITSIVYIFYTKKGVRSGYSFNIFDFTIGTQKVDYFFAINVHPEPHQHTIFYSSIYKSPYDFDGNVPTPILDSINKKLDNRTVKDLDDCLFELRKVVRVKTDYKP